LAFILAPNLAPNLAPKMTFVSVIAMSALGALADIPVGARDVRITAESGH
jgi:hypothetical protein